MKWIEAKVLFEFHDKALAVELISNIFYDFGLQGVVVEDPDTVTEVDWADDALPRPQADAVIGYWAEQAGCAEQRQILERQLARLKSENGLIYRIVYRKLDEEAWADSWKAFFWPEKVGEHLVVKPTWREYTPRPGEIVIEIDPGMAFGTGTHPTTTLCLRLIEKRLNPGASFLDVGTGSGILMIAAAKYGASRLHGIDLDDVAVDIAARNLRQNNIPSERFTVTTGHLVEGIDQRYDFIVANILADVVLALLEMVPQVLAKEGILVCSGIIEADKEGIIEKVRAKGFTILETLTRDQWVAIAATLK